MLLPNGKRAIVDVRKLRDYCLNPDNPRGCNKARVFASALGITAADSDRLRAQLLEAASTGEARLGELDMYGQRLPASVPRLHCNKSGTALSGSRRKLSLAMPISLKPKVAVVYDGTNFQMLSGCADKGELYGR
jgi:hypothetical protein